MSDLQKYKPMIKIITYDDEVYYSDVSLEDMAKITANPTNKFIAVQDSLVPINQIKKITKHSGMGYESLPKAQKEAVAQMIRTYQDNLGEYPKPENIKIMINKIVNGTSN